ncbi:MAG: PIN domain-containing protein [Flavobacteriaceae bacterium]|nr:PIN domain-containing protein [Flavobacteriaceae bacterium]
MKGQELIKNICEKVPAYEELFNSRVRHYIIKEHILNVFNQFELYFSKYFIQSKIEEFRLFLLLHDIGKSLAYKQGNRNNQYSTTISAIQNHQTELGISEEQFKIYKALLSASSFGKYMENKASLDDTYATISEQSKNSNLSINDFFYFLSVYYQCDVASYTRDAGGIAYLEHLFEYQNGIKVYCEKTNLLKFSDLYAQRYNLVFDKIHTTSVASNQPVINNINTVSTQDIQLKVVGKIDLSKFEKPKKEIKKNKVNYYIIDTNVFIDYPEIITKIAKDYPIILSAKVIDELDNLKSTMDNNGKVKVQKALKSINKNIDKRNLKMVVADLSLLPIDFNKRSPDNMILSVALKYASENPILLTSDNGLQIKAKGLRITTITLKEFLKR